MTVCNLVKDAVHASMDERKGERGGQRAGNGGRALRMRNDGGCAGWN